MFEKMEIVGQVTVNNGRHCVFVASKTSHKVLLKLCHNLQTFARMLRATLPVPILLRVGG